MGTGFDVILAPEEHGIIPRAVEHLFSGIIERQRTAIENGTPKPEFKIEVQFIEVIFTFKIFYRLITIFSVFLFF